MRHPDGACYNACMTDQGAGLLLRILVFIFGACVGSFVNVAAYRLPREISIVRPRSFCPHCLAPVPLWCNVPVLGYLILRARCARCGGRIGARYFITEVLLGLIALFLYANFTPLDALARFALCAALFVASWVDLDWRIIPDVVSLPGVVAGFAAASLLMPEIGWENSLLGIGLGGGLLFAIGEGYRWLRGKEGMGLGDVKLLAMIGAFLGWQGVIFTLFFGSCLGAAGGIVLGLLDWQPGSAELHAAAAQAMAVGDEISPGTTAEGAPEAQESLLQTPVPFGPFLSIAAGIFALFQTQLVHWYLS
jgi:leader peptidase (prepilin peptidase) / N-methyltransferase